MIIRKHEQINNTSKLTKLMDPANKLLHHQSKQAIHQFLLQSHKKHVLCWRGNKSRRQDPGLGIGPTRESTIV